VPTRDSSQESPVSAMQCERIACQGEERAQAASAATCCVRR
jgi:hypothetical protein